MYHTLIIYGMYVSEKIHLPYDCFIVGKSDRQGGKRQEEPGNQGKVREF